MEEREILTKVEAIVCAGEDIKPEWLHRGPRGRNYLTLPRQIIMTLLRQVFRLPYSCIGGFYKRNHEVAMFAETAVMNLCDTDKEFKARYQKYVEAVSGDMPGLFNLDVAAILQGEIKRDVEEIQKRQALVEEILGKLGVIQK